MSHNFLAVMLVATLGGCGVDEVQVESETRGKADMANALDLFPGTGIPTNETQDCRDMAFRSPSAWANGPLDYTFVYQGDHGANLVDFKPDYQPSGGSYLALFDYHQVRSGGHVDPLLLGFCPPGESGKKSGERARRLERAIGEYKKSEAASCLISTSSTPHPPEETEHPKEAKGVRLAFLIPDDGPTKYVLQVGPLLSGGLHGGFWLKAACPEEGSKLAELAKVRLD